MTQPPLDGAGNWVLAPGTLCTGRVFNALLNELEVDKSDCHIITPDAPHVQDYDARLRDAVTGGQVVCGFSLGALILAHNLRALKNARAVVLLASNPMPDPPENRAMRETVCEKVMSGGARDWVNENWAALSASRSEHLRDLVATMAEDAAHLIHPQTKLAISRPGAQGDLARTDLPLIFVTGSEDKLTPSERVESITKTAKHAHLSVIDGLGHFALLEAPARVALAIRQGFKALGLAKI